MRGSEQIGPATKRCSGRAALIAAAFALLICGATASPAQINGTAPSVTSIPMSHFLPNPAPSVTSLGPFGYGRGVPSNLGTAPNISNYPYRQFPYTRTRDYGDYGYGSREHGNYSNGSRERGNDDSNESREHRNDDGDRSREHGRGYGYGYGYGYSIPYYVPYDTSGYGYDYVSGSDLYSGPPMGPNEPTLHIIVEQPPAQPPQAYQSHVTADSKAAAPPQGPPEPPHDAAPVDPTVLVFRDGHKQEVANYAIMGQTVYVFDDHTKKIALADLDLPATIKANDDRGREFQVPPPAAPKKKDSATPKQHAPASSTVKPSTTAALVLP
jgi:hypothetical protein